MGGAEAILRLSNYPSNYHFVLLVLAIFTTYENQALISLSDSVSYIKFLFTEWHIGSSGGKLHMS